MRLKPKMTQMVWQMKGRTTYCLATKNFKKL